MLRSALVLAVGCVAVGMGMSAGVEAAEKMPAYISAALADPGRPAEDKDRDANRKPGETIEFSGIKPGTQVAELIPWRFFGADQEHNKFLCHQCLDYQDDTSLRAA